MAENKKIGSKCSRCKKGVYKEMSVMDDIRGVITCTNCGHQISNKYEQLRKACLHLINVIPHMNGVFVKDAVDDVKRVLREDLNGGTQ